MYTGIENERTNEQKMKENETNETYVQSAREEQQGETNDVKDMSEDRV